MTDKTTEAGRATPATGAVGSLVDQVVGRLVGERKGFWRSFWLGAAQATAWVAVCALLFFAGAWTGQAWR